MSSNRSGLAARENSEMGFARRSNPATGISRSVWPLERRTNRAKRGAREKNISTFGKFSD
jgi:AraC-like DNA-binding protein